MVFPSSLVVVQQVYTGRKFLWELSDQKPRLQAAADATHVQRNPPPALVFLSSCVPTSELSYGVKLFFSPTIKDKRKWDKKKWGASSESPRVIARTPNSSQLLGKYCNSCKKRTTPTGVMIQVINLFQVNCIFDACVQCWRHFG